MPHSKQITLNEDALLHRLRRRWRTLITLGVVGILAAAVVTWFARRPGAAALWGGLALIVWLYQGVFVWHRLERNHRPDEITLLGDFGPGTSLTFLRGWLLACLAGFLLILRPAGGLGWLPAVTYVLADVADYLDGYLARVSNHATLLGEALDIEFDALGLLIAVALAIHYSVLPVWYLPVGLARYAFLFGLWLRERTRRAVFPLPPSESRRPLAGLQMGMLSVMLIPILRPPVTSLAGPLFGIPLLAGFARDWFVVSGVVDPASEGYQRLRYVLRLILLRWLPIPLRLIAFVQVALLTRPWILVASGAAGAMPITGPESMSATSTVVRLAEITAAVAIALGVAPRVSACVVLGTLVVRAAGGDLSPAMLTALLATVGVLILGSGALSIWQPEPRWLGRRAGEKTVDS
jgi:CDP-diacylglycerol--glycerol-3-phosphate 3-phosphatidyltransferase